MNVGADSMDYVGSPDDKLWSEWHAAKTREAVLTFDEQETP